jgi:hypothetical protein
MERFMTLDAAALATIRKTTEDPPRVSVYDLISAVVGKRGAARKAFERLDYTIPDVTRVPIGNSPELASAPLPSWMHVEPWRS